MLGVFFIIVFFSYFAVSACTIIIFVQFIFTNNMTVFIVHINHDHYVGTMVVIDSELRVIICSFRRFTLINTSGILHRGQ